MHFWYKSHKCSPDPTPEKATKTQTLPFRLVWRGRGNGQGHSEGLLTFVWGNGICVYGSQQQRGSLQHKKRRRKWEDEGCKCDVTVNTRNKNS